MLSFLHGMILLAAVAMGVLVRVAVRNWEKFIVWAVFVLFGLLSPLLQTYLANYCYYADTRNPYVYAHTTEDIFALTNRVEQIARVHPEGYNMPIQVICPQADYWPLPWYLRQFTNVGWWNKVDESVPVSPLIITSAELQSQVIEHLYNSMPANEKHLYVRFLADSTELRPDVELVGLITKQLADKCQ